MDTIAWKRLARLSAPFILIVLFTPALFAETWLVVDFGASAPENVYGLPGWDTAIVSPNTVYTDAGQGGTISDETVGENWALNFQGVQGTPREFIEGERVIVTWRNVADYDIWFTPRISLDDPDGFNIGEQTGHWYGMSDTTGNRYRTEEFNVASNETLTTVYDINTEPAEGVPSSIGPHSLINVTVGTWDFARFIVCERIELSDEVDVTPPAPPTGLRAWNATDYAVELAWDEAADDTGISEYMVYLNDAPYRKASEPQIQLTGLEAQTNYTVSVSAFDLKGNESARSSVISIVTQPFQGSASLINPSADLTYLGAFTLPDGEYGANDFYYSGTATAYYPDGDPQGGEDGFPGSIFWAAFFAEVAEIDIPLPVVSTDRDVSQLNQASVLQDFYDISGGYPFTDLHWWQGLAYLPAQGNQTSEHLYYCFAEHLYFEERNEVSHAWFDLDLANPNMQGMWRMGGNLHNYLTCRYLFEIPETWANQHTPGQRLVTGRHRDGGQIGAGPSMYAIGPWNDGNPPPDGAELSYTTLLEYGDYTTGRRMENWAEGDDWTGGVWIEAGGKSAVMFAGTKFIGHTYYGYHNGQVFTDIEFDSAFTEHERGWMGTETLGQFLFYDPGDLAAVAAGEMAAYEPQPYAVMNVDDVLFRFPGVRPNEIHVLNSPSYDRERNLIYIVENRDPELPVVHVWRVEPAVKVESWPMH